MSQNDHTGLEGYTVLELVNEAYRVFEPLVHPQLLMELAKRLDAASDEIAYLESVKERVGRGLDDAKAVCAAVCDSSIETDEIVKIIHLCEEHDIETAAALRGELEAIIT